MNNFGFLLHMKSLNGHSKALWYPLNICKADQFKWHLHVSHRWMNAIDNKHQNKLFIILSNDTADDRRHLASEIHYVIIIIRSVYKCKPTCISLHVTHHMFNGVRYFLKRVSAVEKFWRIARTPSILKTRSCIWYCRGVRSAMYAFKFDLIES